MAVQLSKLRGGKQIRSLGGAVFDDLRQVPAAAPAAMFGGQQGEPCASRRELSLGDVQYVSPGNKSTNVDYSERSIMAEMKRAG